MLAPIWKVPKSQLVSVIHCILFAINQEELMVHGFLLSQPLSLVIECKKSIKLLKIKRS
jgi:hypothetical protein